MARYVILTVAQLFEKLGKRHPIHSIPAAIAFLDNHADALVIEQRLGLLQSLARLGASVTDVRESSDPELTRFVARFFEKQASRIDVGEEGDTTRALTALKSLRDKVVAHGEAVRLEDLPKPTYADIDRIVALARAFVGAVAFGYLTVAYEDDRGDSSISSDAERAEISLRRLLERAGVLSSNREGA
jgi:HEPN superfamily AbiU2-like protein